MFMRVLVWMRAGESSRAEPIRDPRADQAAAASASAVALTRSSHRPHAHPSAIHTTQRPTGGLPCERKAAAVRRGETSEGIQVDSAAPAAVSSAGPRAAQQAPTAQADTRHGEGCVIGMHAMEVLTDRPALDRRSAAMGAACARPTDSRSRSGTAEEDTDERDRHAAIASPAWP